MEFRLTSLQLTSASGWQSVVLKTDQSRAEWSGAESVEQKAPLVNVFWTNHCTKTQAHIYTRTNCVSHQTAHTHTHTL